MNNDGLAEGAELNRPPEQFTTENIPLALQMRFALNQLNPDNVNLPDVDAATIVQTNEENKSAVRKTIAKAATNDAVDKWIQKEREDPALRDHQQKVNRWKQGLVATFGRDENQTAVQTLREIRIANIDFSNMNDERAQAIYDRWVARSGKQRADTVEKGQRKFVLYDIDGFVNDMLDAHAQIDIRTPQIQHREINYESLGRNLNAINWLATRIFSAEDAQNIYDDLSKEIQLHTNRDAFINQANEKKPKEIQGEIREVSRLNWPHGQSQQEYFRLLRLYQAQNIATVEVDLTQPHPPRPRLQTPPPAQTPPRPTPISAPRPGSTPRPAPAPQPPKPPQPPAQAPITVPTPRAGESKTEAKEGTIAAMYENLQELMQKEEDAKKEYDDFVGTFSVGPLPDPTLYPGILKKARDAIQKSDE